MKHFLPKLWRAGVEPKLPLTAWWAWRSLGFGSPAAMTGRVSVGSRAGRLEWRQTGELLQAMSIFAPENPWNQWEPATRIDTILDVGANIGQTVAYWKLRFPSARVGAVEMMPDNVTRISSQAGLNGWSVGLVPVAATDITGTVTVRLSMANSRNRIEDIVDTSAVRDGLRAETETVPALPLAAIMDRLGFERVDLMKVDIEGAEVNLLRDIRNWAHRVNALIIEIHDNVDERWARAALETAGYRIQPMEARGNPEWLCLKDDAPGEVRREK